ncbi:hypothetical protein BDV93DRAFT_543823 [Ceratobasidium sp. AG-I]|nr:hypothetical protein BDV93DRAFT_543823 [Ceratobasidium sp. AG-I]
MMSSGSSSANFLGLYGQSPRHAAALYTDARDSMRVAASSSASSSRKSMQSSRSVASSCSSYDYISEEPSSPADMNTPPPPYSCRASVLPETLTPPSLNHLQESRPVSTLSSDTPAPTSRAQKRRSSVMIKDLGMRILCAK